jgi:hypothetical protein
MVWGVLPALQRFQQAGQRLADLGGEGVGSRGRLVVAEVEPQVCVQSSLAARALPASVEANAAHSSSTAAGLAARLVETDV